MLKSKTSRLASLLVAIVMAFGLGLSGAKNLFASAAVADATDTLTFNSENQYTDTFDVPADTARAQYMFVLKVTDPAFTGEDAEKYNSLSFSVTIERGEETYADYMSYNSILGGYYVVMLVNAGERVTFVANYNHEEGDLAGVTEIAASLTMGGLQIGAFSGNALYGVNLPASVVLNGVPSGNYYVTISAYSDDGTVYTVDVGEESVTLPYVEGLGGYSAPVALTDGQTLQFSAKDSAGAAIYPTVDIVLRGEASYTAFNGEVKLRAGETAVYSYTATATGFYLIEQGESAYESEDGTAVPVEAYYGVLLKENPNYVVGTYVVEGYPVRFVEGTTYYFEISCYSVYVDEGDPLVTTTFTVAPWTGATLALYEMVYAPVSVAGSETTYNLTADLGAGEYAVSLFDVPEHVDSVTMHFGSLGVELTSANGYTAQFTLENAVTTVWLTSGEEFVVGLFVEEYVAPQTITVGVAKEITLAPDEGVAYYVEGLAAGTYLVDLAGNTGVTVLDPTGGIVANAGETFGLFTADEYTVEGYFLYFVNYSGESVTLTATVTVETHLLELDTPTEITFTDAIAALTYYVQHIYAGDYILSIENPDGLPIGIECNGQSVTTDEASYSFAFTVDLTDEEGVELPYTNLAILLKNADENEFTFTVTLSVVPPIEE